MEASLFAFTLSSLALHPMHCSSLNRSAPMEHNDRPSINRAVNLESPMCFRGCLKVRCDNSREVPVIKEKWIAFVEGDLIVEALH